MLMKCEGKHRLKMRDWGVFTAIEIENIWKRFVQDNIWAWKNWNEWKITYLSA